MLSKDQILKCLSELGEELAALGMQGEILLAGGASMCLVHEARDMTKDVDALYEPKTIINSIAINIAERNGLPRDWLNDGVKGFIGANASTEEFMCLCGLRVQTVSAEYLLAMKLMSARYGEKDYDDIRFLIKKLGINSKEQAYDIVQAYFAQNQIMPKTKYIIEEIISET